MVRAVLATTPLGWANGAPVGGFVAGTQELFRIDKALYQPGPIAVLGLKIRADLAQHPAQHRGGQVTAMD